MNCASHLAAVDRGTSNENTRTHSKIRQKYGAIIKEQNGPKRRSSNFDDSLQITKTLFCTLGNTMNRHGMSLKSEILFGQN